LKQQGKKSIPHPNHNSKGQEDSATRHQFLPHRLLQMPKRQTALPSLPVSLTAETTQESKTSTCQPHWMRGLPSFHLTVTRSSLPAGVCHLNPARADLNKPWSPIAKCKNVKMLIKNHLSGVWPKQQSACFASTKP
jgi:hypothetical protein